MSCSPTEPSPPPLGDGDVPFPPLRRAQTMSRFYLAHALYTLYLLLEEGETPGQETRRLSEEEVRLIRAVLPGDQAYRDFLSQLAADLTAVVAA